MGDISKTLDRVRHKGFIYKICKYDICGNVLQWIGSLLDDRKQLISIDISERQKQQKVVMVLLHLLLFIIGATAGTSHNSDFGK